MARKSAVGAWFSRWLAQNTCELLPSCLENLTGTAHLGCQGQRVQLVNQTFFSTIVPFSLHLCEMRLSPSLYYRAEGSNCLLLRAENHKSKGFSEVTQNPRAMALPPAPTHGSVAVPGLEQGHSPDTQPLSWAPGNIASSLSGWNAVPCPKFLWSKSHFHLHVHSTWALLPLSPPKPWTTLPQPHMHCFIILHITKRKTSLNASSTHHWCLQYLLSLFFLSNWILICPVWDSHWVVCVLNAQLLAEHLPFY